MTPTSETFKAKRVAVLLSGDEHAFLAWYCSINGLNFSEAIKEFLHEVNARLVKQNPGAPVLPVIKES